MTYLGKRVCCEGCSEGVTVGKVSEESIGLVQVFEVAFALCVWVCVCVCVCVYVCMSERVRVSE